MDMTSLNTNILTGIAISALKKAYVECSDKAAKDSIVTAFKAVIQLHHDFGRQHAPDMISDSDCEYDPSEYCAAV